jgi:hypothetical protein
MQSRDYLYFKGQRFTLIDVEKGKQIIDYGHFNIPKISGGFCSSCWRGYEAIYSVEKKQLWGIMIEHIFLDDEKRSNKVPVYFTGSCIIALDDENEINNSDFLEAYLDYNYAYELHFTRGILNKINDISQAIQEAKEIDKSDQCDYFKKRELLARKYLKYKYDQHNTYKWRYPAAVKLEKEFKMIWESRRKNERL